LDVDTLAPHSYTLACGFGGKQHGQLAFTPTSPLRQAFFENLRVFHRTGPPIEGEGDVSEGFDRMMLQLYVLNGPDRGDSYRLIQGTNYVGRSMDNDVRIEDRTVSRKHLRIFRENDKCFITDLKSRNGTFYRGSFITPGASVQVELGFPIALGMAVVCVGESCADEIMPFPELLGLAIESKEQGDDRRRRPNQKRMEFVLKLADVFRENLSIRETQEKILRHVLRFLRRIDRASFVLIDPETRKTTLVTSRSKKSHGDASVAYCREVITQVVKTRRPIVVSNVETEQQSALVDTLKVLKILSVMCVPLIYRSHILGAMYVDSLERPYGFRRDDLLLFMDLSQRVAIGLENIRMVSEISSIADSLTDSD
jgi:pSer/pThr/pTyr-binding forkhead associated (FHA) protein